MSFTMDNTNSRVYAPGWFLADNENCERKTRQIAQLSATTAPNGTKFVPMGTIYPSNDAYVHLEAEDQYMQHHYFLTRCLSLSVCYA